MSIIVLVGVLLVAQYTLHRNLPNFPFHSLAPAPSAAQFFSTSTPGLASTKQGGGQIMSTQSVTCHNSKYIVDLVLYNDSYYSAIYNVDRSPGHLLVRVEQEKTASGGKGVLRILSVPKNNCDRIYLTRYIPDTESPERGLFVWLVDQHEIHELAESERFSSFYTPSAPELPEAAISPDGERLLVAEPLAKKFIEGQFCDRRTLRVVNLHDDTSKVVVNLPSTENFTRSNAEDSELLYCLGLDFGWQNDSSIHFNVYDATVASNRSLKERRTLIVR